MSDEDYRLSVAKNLEGLGIIRLSPFRIVKCALEGDSDFDDLTADQIECPGEAIVQSGQRDASCSRCGRRILVDGKKVFPNHLITLDSGGIVRFVRRLVAPKSPLVRNRVPGLLVTRFNKTLVRICIPEACKSDIYVTWYEHFKEPIVYIISNTAGVYKNDYSPETIVITLAELLSATNPSNLLSSAVREAFELLVEAKTRVSFVGLLGEFEKAVAKMTPSEFEKFIGRFLEDLKKRPDQLENYKRKLSRRSKSLLGSIIRVIGGSGAEDIMVEPKAEYLANLFSSSGTYEMKKYTTTLMLDDLSELVRHCEQRGTSGILFTSTDRVASSVWNGIRSIKTSQGSWKYIVVDRNLILELLVELGLTNMLSA